MIMPVGHRLRLFPGCYGQRSCRVCSRAVLVCNNCLESSGIDFYQESFEGLLLYLSVVPGKAIPMHMYVLRLKQALRRKPPPIHLQQLHLR